MPAGRTPASTYRLQITASFDLHAATRQLSYLHDLGVDWVYLSPLLSAEPGSPHGYDVVDPSRIDPARGGPEGLAALSAEARRLGMGVLVDIVPNHVGVASPEANAWWRDLLQHGRESAYADYFDIDWDAGGGVIRSGEQDLNYRRFFTITSLAGLRVEEPAVFDASHVEIRRWFQDGLVDGLRVDHPDGLLDPKGYLDDLAELTGGGYVVMEKILEPGERLPEAWATAGTTGYDALALIDRVLIDPAGEAPLSALAARLGAPTDWPVLVHDSKRAVADGPLHAEVRRIVRDLMDVEGQGRTRPEPPSLVDAVAELMACFPVYRSYLPDGRADLDHAFAAAHRRRPDLTAAFDRVRPLLRHPTHPAALRFQQTSGMVMAKGVEDGAFYRYPRLTSLNEVGGDPSMFSISVDEFHAAMRKRQADRPHAMTTLSTHDTKRAEDVRARIAVLAEIPRIWAAHLDQLLTLAPMPDPGFGSLLWQAVLGAWPASRERLHAYAEKAMREAGDHTTWTAPDAAYEAHVHEALGAIFENEGVRRVLAELLEHVVPGGWSNALVAKLVAITIPGVPDVYQGSELWDLSLVDPDNRRPVDFDLRRDLLGAVRAGAGVRLRPDEDDTGTVKLLVTHRALTLRRDRRELFTTYEPLSASGRAADHVLAFDRGGAVTVVTRLPIGLAHRGGWGDTTLALPPGRWRDVLTGRAASSRLDGLLSNYPMALLIRDDEP